VSQPVSADPKHVTRQRARHFLAVFFFIAGLNHFLNPKPYLSMMPKSLPAHEALNIISGLAEMLGGIGVLIPSVRRFTGWCLIILLIAIFPANINAAVNGWEGVSIPAWLLWARLPLQFALIYWVYFACLLPKPALVAGKH
jgi:uncharacterized membrane protein